ncbi:MAG: TfoX/Sxy family protein [Bacteroidetes bacterium]|nr:TfoX/Sxy family protein [Bacteroidota bacterium]
MDALPLTKLPNIGKTLAEKLISVGITNEFELKSTGSENAIIKIHTFDKNDTCINMLYAIEGAIQGIRWHNLENYRKQELKLFYHQLTK